MFRGTAPTDPHQKLKSVGVQPLGFGKGWSLPQERNSASSSQKFAYIKRSKTIIPNTERTKPQIKKSRMQKKKQQSIIIYTAKERSVEHQSCMRRFDR